MEYIFLLGAAQGFLLTFFLLSKKENHLPNRLFALTIFVYSIDIMYAFVTVKKLYLIYPQLIGLAGPPPFIYSPAIYLYTVYVSRNYKTFRRKDLLHFLPVSILILSGVYFILYGDTASKIELMNPDVPKSFFVVFMRTIIPFYGITYTIFSLKEVMSYHSRLKDNYSNIEKLKLDWLIYLLVGIITVWTLELIQIILIEVLNKKENFFYNYIYLFISIFMYFVAFKSLKQPEIFLQHENEKPDEIKEITAYNEEEKSTGYKKSGLSDEKANSILEELLAIMEKNKPYITPNLNLNELASLINVTPHNLSEVINTKLNQTFYDFISYYRIEEVKRLMHEDKAEAYSILSIAFDAGFNSKSTFNNIFKKVTGITPSEYRKSINSKN